MELEIFLDLKETAPGEQEIIRSRFLEWHAAGAGKHPDGTGYGDLVEAGEQNRFRLDPGRIDALTAINDLHAGLQGHGVKIFIRFLHR